MKKNNKIVLIFYILKGYIKFKLAFLFFLVQLTVFGQLGIGTTNPHASSILELESSNRGMLIPRIALQGPTDNTTMNDGNVESLLIYNTTVSNDLKKGFYYWTGSNWELLNTDSSTWSTTGDANTDPNTNFVGTTDNTELWFRTNNTKRLRVGQEIAGSSFNNLHLTFRPASAYTGNVFAINNELDVQSGGSASNVFGIENLMYLRSGSSLNPTSGLFRAQRNRIWNINTANYPYVTGVLNEYKGEGTDITTFYGFQNTLDFRAGSYTTNMYGFSNDFPGQVNGTVTNYYGFYSGIHSSLGGVTNYYGFYQPNLGTNANRYAFYYKGNATTTKDVVVTGVGRIGVGVSQPHSDLQIEGSVSKKFNTTSTSTGVFNINETHYTVRILNDIASVNLPNPNTCTGRIYILIGSNGISSKNITVAGGANVYDDVTNQNITSISANQRYHIQSDATNWIVIGN